MGPWRMLTTSMLLYGAASFVHFARNAAYLADYPNMPSWLSASGVMAAWAVVAAIGLAGWRTNVMSSRATAS